MCDQAMEFADVRRDDTKSELLVQTDGLQVRRFSVRRFNFQLFDDAFRFVGETQIFREKGLTKSAAAQFRKYIKTFPDYFRF